MPLIDDQDLQVSALVDSGAAVNLLPYDIGLQLGFRKIVFDILLVSKSCKKYLTDFASAFIITLQLKTHFPVFMHKTKTVLYHYGY
jgi:hypothetical protein